MRKTIIVAIGIFLLFILVGIFTNTLAQGNRTRHGGVFPPNAEIPILKDRQCQKTDVYGRNGRHPVRMTQCVLKGDGRTDDTAALNAWGRGETVLYRGRRLGNVLENGTFLVSWDVKFNRRFSLVRNNTFIVKNQYRTNMIDFDWLGVRHYGNLLVSEERFNRSARAVKID